MLKNFIFSTLFSLLAFGVNAQWSTNLSLENWDASMSGQYDEPSGWATGNSPVDLPIVPPPTNPVEKTTDAYEGTYAVKMETITLLFETASGSIWLGDFAINILEPEKSALFGIPYADRPYSLSGYYKYNALNGDSCDLYMTLFNSNYDPSTTRGDTVAHSQIRSDVEVANYTPFELVLDYKSAAQVDTIQIVFASSAAGASLMGQVGAKLFVDGLVLNMTPNGIKHVLMPEVTVKTFPNPTQDYLHLEIDKLLTNGKLEVFGSDGKQVITQKINGMNPRVDVTKLPNGSYHYLLSDERGAGMNSGTFVVGE